ncbi:hypothetical protein JTE90_010754 [Oedothorax gibbosus]|uniref:C2H2-type domain-containing protein n=1 Tax=Oedothorax gibbosus TaxID=931172 RepID=A0AAV6UDF0_9ARAC|nr:hypothetical protein JTE90_010754 [Oedothorax gibbosus]
MSFPDMKSFPILENKIKVLPHSCFICSKAFVRKNTLLKHYKEHTKELGENLEHLEEQRAKYLAKKFPNGVPKTASSVENEKVYPTEFFNLDNNYNNTVQQDFASQTEESAQNDQSVIQNLDSNDIIITPIDSSVVMVQDLDPHSIVVEHLEPQPVSSDSFPLPLRGNVERHGCTICGNCFSSAASLSRHLTIHDDTEAASVCKFICTLCSAGFVRKISLKNHYKTHKGEEPFACKLCSEKFFTKEDLATHKFEFHKIKNKKRHDCGYMCEICGADFFKKSALKMHYLSHPEERPFVCDVCNESFSDEGSFEDHKMVHVAGLSFLKCKVCKEKFNSKADLQNHKMLVHDNGKVSLKSDAKNSRKPKSKRVDESPSKQMIYVCNDCDEAFKTKQELETHKKSHSRKRFTCDICEESLTKNEYDNHMLMHNEGKMHTCRICSEIQVQK